ncbi:MAG: hypothetical protein ACO3P1_11375, partial [Pseudomonadales bacterium]
MRTLVTAIWRRWLTWTLRRQRVLVVTGLRRSGNHACIEWLSNALEGHAVAFSHLGPGVFLSETGNIIHFNEANWEGPLDFAKKLRVHRESVKQSHVVIISLEDYAIEPSSPFVPHQAVVILITRTLKNIIASRLTYALKQAALGLDRGDMRIDDYFMRTARWLKHAEGPGMLRWNYDLWFSNQDNYRLDFLARLGLTSDIAPEMSRHGGGSSRGERPFGSDS